VRIDKIGPNRRQRPPHRKDSAQILAANGKRAMGKRASCRLCKNSRAGDGPDFDLVPARDHPLRFFEYADLLAAPAHRRLGVRDSKGSPSLSCRAVGQH